MGYFRLDNVSADFAKKNAAVLGMAKVEPKNTASFEGNGKERVKSLNKTETLFYALLLRTFEKSMIFPQKTRFFPLTGGGTYTPDFMVFANGNVFVYEVKGGYRGPGWEQGIERYRRAAFEWSKPPFRFILADYDRKRREWKTTEFHRD